MLEIRNDGPLIVASNYWQSAAAAAGKLYLSTNAGCFRLLVPRALESVIAELETGRVAVVSRGPWPAMGLSDAVEILLDDGSDSPFAMHLDLNSLDRLPTDADAGPEWRFAAWIDRRGSPHRALERPAFYRRVPRLPCLEPYTKPA